jgi:UDP:flavonoid glycosyltransferase YjiC (YdhE family)
MRISIQTLGTRGDVQPYVALALGLMGNGHEVQLAAPVQFAALAEERGVPFAPLPGEFLALLDTDEGKAAIAGGRGFSAGLKMLKHVRPLMRSLLDEEWAAVGAFRPHLVVYHPKSLGTPHIAERLGCPAVLASPLPGFTPTSAFPSPMLPFASLGPLNRASHVLIMRATRALFGGMLADWRATSLGLSGRRARVREPNSTLYAYSAHVVPRPADWGADVLVTGYWFLDDENWQVPDSLSNFLGAGAPPVYVGFGSMPGLEPRALAAQVIEALRLTGKRGLLAIGGGALEIDRIPPHIHVVAGAPHDRLFPHVSATVHHGGAGTTGASLRAGIPTVICPFFGDQPFWGRRVYELGVGPRVLDRKTLTAGRLAAAIAATDDPGMRAKAADLGARIRREEGVAAAVAQIERVLAQTLRDG